MGKDFQRGLKAGMVMHRFEHIRNSLPGIAKRIFSPGAPVERLFQDAVAIQSGFGDICQVDDILVAAGVIVSLVGTGLVPHHAVRTVLLRQGVVKGKCLIVSQRALTVISQQPETGALVEPGKECVNPGQSGRLLPGRLERLLECPGFRPPNPPEHGRALPHVPAGTQR